VVVYKGAGRRGKSPTTLKLHLQPPGCRWNHWRTKTWHYFVCRPGKVKVCGGFKKKGAPEWRNWRNWIEEAEDE